MKIKTLSILLAAVAWCTAACQKAPCPKDGTSAELTVNLAGLAPETKATVGTAEENKVNSLTLYAFDATGMLDVSHTCSSEEIKALKAKLRIKTGNKTIYAVANMSAAMQARANAIYRIDGLEAVPYELADNAPGGLVMRGSMSIPVSGAGGEVTVALTRGVARVALNSVKNSLPAPYGEVTLRHAFLCNVVGNQDLVGRAEANPEKYVNQEATRGHVRTQVIGVGGNKAECESLTWQTLGKTVAAGKTESCGNSFFYAFPNALATPNNGFNDTFTPTATVLMVVASVRGIDYYYPVPLTGGLAENTEYKVDLTLSGLGNTEDDPFARIEKADLNATISVSPWNSGTPISETI